LESKKKTPQFLNPKNFIPDKFTADLADALIGSNIPLFKLKIKII
jgi:hypothetical protein